MDVEKARAFLMTLPHVVETMQWGDNLVFWVGDKAIGGKMFVLLNLESAEKHGVVSYAAGAERYAELIEIEGMLPAPYFAKIYWVAAQRWSVMRDAAWQTEMRHAHAITLGKLPKKVLEVLALPERARKKLIAERRRVLAKKTEARSS